VAYILSVVTNRSWILKKFLPGRNPVAAYINAIQALVPAGTGFESGYQRRVLSSRSVGNGFTGTEFLHWVDKTILMPRVPGSDWMNLADSLRTGAISLTMEQRVAMCRNLLGGVQALEAKGLSHRDLSLTNVFVDPNTWDVHFIDWDTLYHKSLLMPANTAIGTNGYTAPFVKTTAGEDASLTWCIHADRFAMAVLCIEFLFLEQSTPMANDGGMFEQDDLYQRHGDSLDRARRMLRPCHNDVTALFERALAAPNFGQCPSSADWLTTPSLAKTAPAPRLDDVEHFMARFDHYVQGLQRQQPPRPAPPLSSFPAVRPVMPPPAAAAPHLDDFETFTKPR
jgi:serine/threonine protein kinase